jgi:DNA mismatch repair ATPase MutL
MSYGHVFQWGELSWKYFPPFIPINHSPPDNPVIHITTLCSKCKDSGLKLELQLNVQVEDKYLVTVCGEQLVLWDQQALHERIRLEEMIVSTLTPGDSHSLRAV